MKRISKPISFYQVAQDARQEPIRFGKYIYLTTLLLVGALIVHTLFGHWYVLQGEGFVYSENQAIALEFDTTVSNLQVQEGQRVQKEDLLFNFDSFDLKNQLFTMALQLSDLQERYSNALIQLTEIDAQLISAGHFASFTKDLDKALETLQKRKLMAPTQMSAEVQRGYDARTAITSYQTQKKQITHSLQVLEKNIEEATTYYQALQSYFNSGELRAPEAGVVTQLNVFPGSVLGKGNTALQIFYGPRYILGYLNAQTWVSHKVGDKVLVNIPGLGTKIGVIDRLFPISDKLPEEFQPRFKPTQRSQVAFIEIPQLQLDQSALMTTTTISKPLGFGLISWLF